MKTTFATPITLAGLLLGACDGPASRQPITGNHPAPAPPPVAATDTVKPTPMGKSPVPFVNGTKVGRLLGPKEPSPPASRMR